jgi:hypothetical protein
MKVQIILLILISTLCIEQPEIIYNEPPELDALENDKLMACAEIIGVKLKNDQVGFILIYRA